MATRTKHEGLQIAGFCSGIGMLETALETALSVRGVPAQSCYHCEWEACTAAVLRRFIVASGGESLIHGNMFSADCSGLRGKVDAVIAGLPCPAFSIAGKQKGNGDSRAWGENFNPVDESTWGPQPHFLRLAEQILSGIVIIENVPQYLSGGHYAPVGEVLYRMGYEYQDAILGTASSVGGSHKRERCFIMAVHRDYDIRARLGELKEAMAHSIGNGECGGVFPGSHKEGRKVGELQNRKGFTEQYSNGSEELANGDSERLHQPGAEQSPDCIGQPCEELAQERDGGRRGRWGDGDTTGDNRKVQAPGLCGEVSDSDGKQCGQGNRERASEQPPQEHKELGDSENPDRRGEHEEEGTECRRGGSEGADRELPIHAPGIEAYMAWSSVARMDPTRMPSIERGLSVVASEPAVSNVDLLRIGGNCVDALEATACIGCLLDRWLEGC